MNNKQRLSSELLDDFNMSIEEFEENLTDEEIVEVRQYMLAWMLEMFGGWKKGLDCIPDYVQIGAYSGSHIEINKYYNKI